MNRLALSLVIASDYMRVHAGVFRSALKCEDTKDDTRVTAFEMMKTPVTDAEFLGFVCLHPEWQRDRVASVYAENVSDLCCWSAPLQLGEVATPQLPVTQVNGFAASAHCEAGHARLPTWAQWEYVAAADATRRDARSDRAWRESILGWYAKPSTTAVADVSKSPPNVYGVQDMHGLIWEWVEDFASMLVTGDDRSQPDANRLKFCGASALTTQDRENYAVLMRVAMLSSLEVVDSTSNLGFRCARSLPDQAPTSARSP